MKKFFILLLASFIWSFASPLEEVSQLAQQQKKLILVEIVTDFCPYCLYMDKNVLSRDETQKALQNYIFIKLNKDEDKIPPIVQSSVSPTFFILDPTASKVIDEIKGTMERDDFIEYITEIYNQEKPD